LIDGCRFLVAAYQRILDCNHMCIIAKARCYFVTIIFHYRRLFEQ